MTWSSSFEKIILGVKFWKILAKISEIGRNTKISDIFCQKSQKNNYSEKAYIRNWGLFCLVIILTKNLGLFLYSIIFSSIFPWFWKRPLWNPLYYVKVAKMTWPIELAGESQFSKNKIFQRKKIQNRQKNII